jgi:hypothetical protein
MAAEARNTEFIIMKMLSDHDSEEQKSLEDSQSEKQIGASSGVRKVSAAWVYPISTATRVRVESSLPVLVIVGHDCGGPYCFREQKATFDEGFRST